MELLCALVLVSGADVVVAQQYPAYPTAGSYPAYVPYCYQPAPAYSGYTGYPMVPQAAPGYYPAYPGYGASSADAANYYRNYYAKYYPQTGKAPARTASRVRPLASGEQIITKLTSVNGQPVLAVPPQVAMPAGVPIQSVPMADEHMVPENHGYPIADSSAGHVPYGRAHGMSFDFSGMPGYDGNCHEAYWVGGKYMTSWVAHIRTPIPLVTTGQPTDNPPAALGQPGTAILLGSSLEFNAIPGMELDGGIFLDDDNHLAVDAAAFWIFPKSVHFRAASDATGNPIIGRPFFNAFTNAQGVALDSLPNTFTGSASVDARTSIWGAEINGSYHVYGLSRVHADALLGFRYLRLSEELRMQDIVMPLLPNVLTFEGPMNFVNPPNFLVDQDRFRTLNQFYGFQFGGRARWEGDYFFANAFGKLALGVTDQRVTIEGLSTLVSTAGPQVAQGGVLALPTNNGSRSRGIFGIVPEAGIDLGANITQNLRLTIGYSLLYWARVARPGNQIDVVVNPAFDPTSGVFNMGGPGRPAFAFRDETFWVHSLTAGIQWHY
jgi:hypothetical protein